MANVVDPAVSRIVLVEDVNLNTLDNVNVKVSPELILDELIVQATVACHDGVSGCELEGAVILFMAVKIPVTCAESTETRSHINGTTRKTRIFRSQNWYS